MKISSYGSVSASYYYNSLTVEQKAQVNNMLTSLGVDINELSFYFEHLQTSLGNISFFAFVFLIYKKPQILNNLRMIHANMAGLYGKTGFYGKSEGGFSSSPIGTPSSSSGRPSSSSRPLGDAFLTAFSPQDLAKIQDGQKVDLKNGIINSLDSLKQFDKNNDGILSGDELKDLQVAVDKNKDGTIEKGEIVKALEAGVEKIDLNKGIIHTNDGKQIGLNEGLVNVGKGGQNENTNAVTIDVDRSGGQSKGNDNRLQPAPSPILGNNNSYSLNSSSGSSSSSSSDSSSSSASGSSSSSSSGSSSSSASDSSSSSSSGSSSGGSSSGSSGG